MRTLGWKILIAVSINRDELLLYTIAVLYSLSVLHLGMGEHAMERRRVMLQEEIVVEQLVEANIFRPHEQKRPVLHPRQGLWVMVLVRTGTVHLVLEGRNETLCPGEGMIRRADTIYAAQWENNEKTELLVVAFISFSVLLSRLEDTFFVLGTEDWRLADELLEEGRLLLRSQSLPDSRRFAGPQVVRLALERLLINLERQRLREQRNPVKNQSARNLYEQVVQYLNRNIHRKLCLEEVCKANHVGRSHLQKMFREYSGGGVMEYFGILKVKAAKEAIEQSRGTFTQIAQALGYTSIHYFSRHFKKVSGMSPSEYAAIVRLEKHLARSMEGYE